MAHVLLSRRSILQALGAGAALWVARPTVAMGAQTGRLVFAYYSDTHVSLGRNVTGNKAMVSEIARLLRPSFALNVGDVTDYGWKQEYSNYGQVLKEGAFEVVHAPGNHDVRWAARGLVEYEENLGMPFSDFEAAGCHFFVLDSTVPLSHWGHFEKGQLDWLAAKLQGIGRDAPVFIASHHWVGLDRLIIDNEDDLLDIVYPYNVKAILTGHGHKDLLWEFGGIPCLMNRGLYQGSYTEVVVDATADRVSFRCRSADAPGQLKDLLQTPLSAQRRAAPRRLGASRSLTKGEPLRLPEPPKQATWKPGGPVETLTNTLPTSALIAGHNLLVGVDARERPFRQPVLVKQPESPLQPEWETPIGGGVISHLRVEERDLYVSGVDGVLYKFDAESGRVVWRAGTGGYCHSSPTVAESAVLVGSADQHLHAFDRQSGDPLWKFRTNGPVYGTPAIVGKTVAIASGDGNVYGF